VPVQARFPSSFHSVRAVFRADILNLFQRKGELLRQLGFPIAAENSLAPSQAVRLQFFEHGVVTVRNGAVEAWVRPEATPMS
jgi:hypothetical protein